MSNAEVQTLTELLLAGQRLDGRSLIEYREIYFRFPRGTDNEDCGCCIVSIGSTTVMARVSTEVIEPKSYRPSQGMLFVNFDTNLINLPKTGTMGKNNRDEESRRLATVLQTLLRDSIDLDALCIVAWERVFAVRVELRALSYDGNLGDCGALAAIAALAAFRRPDVFVRDDGQVIVDTEAQFRPRVSLGVRRIPVLVTFGLVSDAKLIVQDVCAREDPVLTEGRVMVGVTSFSEICCLYTSGLTNPIRSASLSKCVQLATSRGRYLIALVQCVIDRFNRQQDLIRTAAHARSGELPSGDELVSINAPVVLSSLDFLPTKPPSGEHLLEEGELPDDDGDWSSASDMEVAGSDVEDTTTTASSEALTTKPTYFGDPYGVIEVSTLGPEDRFRLDEDVTVKLEDDDGTAQFGVLGLSLPPSPPAPSRRNPPHQSKIVLNSRKSKGKRLVKKKQARYFSGAADAAARIE